MEVEVYLSEWWVQLLGFNPLKYEWPMPELEKEANVVILEYRDLLIMDYADCYEPPEVASV